MKHLRKAGVQIAVLLAAPVLLAACAAGTVSSDDADSPQAGQLAEQLNAALQQAGLPAVPAGTATSLYGVDGGVSCENAGELQHRLGLYQFGNASLGFRRIHLDPRIVAYDEAVIRTYCPDKLAAYHDKAPDKTSETIP